MAKRLKCSLNPLQRAVSDGNLEDTKSFIQSGININSGGGNSPLHLAVTVGNEEITHLLLDKGANVNGILSENGLSALHLAATLGRLECLKVLIKYGGDLKKRDAGHYGRTPLHWAIDCHTLSVMTWIIENGDFYSLNVTDKKGVPPLALIMKLKNYSLFKILVDRGANVNFKIRSVYGDTALHLAVRYDQEMELDYLLKNRGDSTICNTQQKKSPIHIAAESGNIGLLQIFFDNGCDLCRPTENSKKLPPIHCAVEKGNVDAVTWFLNKGVPIDCVDGEGRTPLHYAAHHNSINVAEAILNHKSDVNIRTKNVKNMTPLHIAVFHDHGNMVRFLCSCHADIHAEDVDHFTPMHYAVTLNRFDCMSKLTECGGDPKLFINNIDRESLLETAIKYNRLSIFDYLLNVGFPVCYRMKNGYTPLHYAALLGNKNMCQSLVLHKAPINEMDDNKRTPILLAVYEGFTEIVKFLLQCNPNVGYLDCTGWNVVHYASQFGHLDCLKLLAKHLNCWTVHTGNSSGLLSIHVAAGCGQEQILLWHLDELHMEIDIKSTLGMTPLWCAVNASQYKIVKLLLDRGADVNAKVHMWDDRTPIIEAVLLQNLELVKLLTQYGADLNVCLKDDRRTALHKSVELANYNITRHLLHHGAKISDLDIGDKTPVDVAEENGLLDFVYLLYGIN